MPRKGPVNDGRSRPQKRFPLTVPVPPNLTLQEFTMADLAFVVTTIAAVALVVLVAKGVAKL
ncbi:hypothetical protein [Streptomyces sp. NPDC048002]|uniref:hypothetical protein n=1 Tax=Streptomyces sp. NPDC048002 TaxID=3154344 RepID=UPI0033CC3DE3